MARAKFTLSEADRLLRRRMRDDFQRSGLSDIEVAAALGMGRSTFLNAMLPDTAEDTPCMFTVERWRRKLRVERQTSALVEFNRSLGFATLPVVEIEGERDPLMRLAAVARELGEASGKLLDAKKKNSDGGRRITISEAREINKEFIDLFSEGFALVNSVLDEAGISPAGLG